MIGQDIVDRAWIKALDEGATKRWGSAEALLWVNDGRREIVNLVPSANTVRSVLQPVSGSRQTFSGLGLTKAFQVLDIPRNMDADGVTPGKVITKVPKAWLDQSRPSWHTETATEADHWVADPADPTAFSLYPAKSAGKIEVLAHTMPDDLTSLANSIGLSDIYANALQWFVLFSFYSKDSEHQKSAALASQYASAFAQSLGVRATNTITSNRAAVVKAEGETP